MQIKELRKMKMNALKDVLDKDNLELTEKRIKIAGDNTEGNVRELRVLKKEIARINTIINEKKAQ